ncbi:MAG: MarR family transcriptional regulator [Thermoleophilaceae bacterium]|nr:MarR family transcriptional regulator [Thermoleophilaceae bacterium]
MPSTLTRPGIEIDRRYREELSARLRLVIARTARRLRQEADGGLTPSQGAALATLERVGPLTPSRLAEIERVQRPTATRLIGKLEEKGLVTRAADPADGRSCVVSLSAEGRALVKRLRSRKTAYLARRLARLDADELRTLDRAAAILERLLEERA